MAPIDPRPMFGGGHPRLPRAYGAPFVTRLKPCWQGGAHAGGAVSFFLLFICILGLVWLAAAAPARGRRGCRGIHCHSAAAASGLQRARPSGPADSGPHMAVGGPAFFICMRGPVWRVIGALVKGLRWLSGAPFLFACRGRPFGGAPYSLAQPPRSAAGRSVQQLQLPLHEVHGLLAPGQGARAALALHSKVALLPSLARVTTSYRSRRGGATSICRGKRRGVANVCRSSWHKVTSVCRSKGCYVLPHISL